MVPQRFLRTETGTFGNRDQRDIRGLQQVFDHFESSLKFETDCWDVHHALTSGQQDFVFLDVRGTEKYAAGHVPGALDLAHRKIIGSKLAEFPADTVFVTYCAGPHCNGAARAAIRLARLGRPVKMMAGGVTGWLDEGFPLHK
jgi:rhodanese-related sulfurtransferase